MLSRDGLPVAPFAGRTVGGEPAMTVVVKATLQLVNDGKARLHAEQPHMSGDVPDPDGGEGAAPLYEADLVPFKPSADAVVVGTYYSPHGRLVPRGRAELNVGDTRHVIDVIGRRTWNLGLLRSGASDPEPFRSLPLRWTYAFGGEDYPANPTGRGHVTKALRKRQDGPFELPRLEWPGQHVRSMTDDVEPANLGPLPRHWGQRARLLGTLDERWEREVWPRLPDDFDPAYECCAPPAMRMDGYLDGDETIALGDLHPAHRWYETTLPGLQAVAGVRRKRSSPGGASGAIDAIEPLDMRLDTLWIDAEHERAVVLWRGRIPVADADLSDVEYLWVDLREGRQDRREVAVSTAAAIRADELEWNIAPEAPPAEAAADAGASAPEPPSTPEADAAPSPDSDVPADAELDAMVARGQEATEQALADLQQQFPPTPAMAAKIAAMRAAAESEAAAGPDDAAGGEDDRSSGPRWTADRVRERLASVGSLAGEDLTGVDLTGVSLAEADLTGTVLDGAVLSGCDLTAARCEGASLFAARLERARLTRAVLLGAVLEQADASGAEASGCMLAGANLRASNWTGAMLEDADLSGCTASGARLDGARLSGATLAHGSFDGASLDGAQLTRADARAADFSRAALCKATMHGTQLAEADLSGAVLDGARLLDADLTHADLEGVNATGADFGGANVEGLRAGEGAVLAGAWLDRIHGRAPIFTNADLGGASIEYARIPGADFGKARLVEARLAHCDLREARLDHADLTGATLFDSDCFKATFEGARLDDVDAEGSSFYAAEFLDASVKHFRGRGRDLTATKLAGSAEDRGPGRDHR